MSLIKKPTILIDSTTDSNYMYIGKCIATGITTPDINKEIWEITRITIVDDKVTKIENGINANNKKYLVWNKRTTYNYI